MSGNYTLYIDESGDFESSRGEWVISGVLLGAGKARSSEELQRKFEKTPRYLGERSIKDFHLTEFRSRYGHELAVEKAGSVLGRLAKLPFTYQLMAVRNRNKRSFSSREITYRVMLADMLALIETVLPSSSTIDHLDVVIASRTINGELQTTPSEIRRDVIGSLPQLMEVDLASRGLVDLLGKHLSVELEYANNSWGLVCADFLANINYHSSKGIEKQLLASLEQAGKFTSFESFDDYTTRRARVAERNGDNALAIHRWLKVEPARSPEERPTQSLLTKVATRGGSKGFSNEIEALMERIWRQGSSGFGFDEVFVELSALEAELELFLKAGISNNAEHLVFRIRNLMLIACNHLGDTEMAAEIIDKQSRHVGLLSMNPEHFTLILDFRLIQTEVHVNTLDFTSALKMASEATVLVDNYKQIWQLLIDSEDYKEFDRSSWSVKSKMALLRLCILSKVGLDSVGDPNPDGLLSQLQDSIRVPAYLKRLRNYELMLMLKRLRWSEAALVAYGRLFGSADDIDSFDNFWCMKAINDCLANGSKLPDAYCPEEVAAYCRALSFDRPGHPNDLIAREVGFFFYLNDEPALAKKYFRQSKKLATVAESPVSKLLRAVLEIHEDELRGQIQPAQEYFTGMEDLPWVQDFLSHRTDSSLVRRIRYETPY